MFRMICPWLCLLAAAHYLPAQVTLVSGSLPQSRIIVDSGNSSDSLAAVYLQRFILESSGAKLPLLQHHHAGAPRPNDVLIGAFQLNSWQPAVSLKEDGFLISTQDGRLRILGGPGKGAIYAALTLLDEYWGMAYWAKGVYHLPKHTDIQLPDIFQVEHPAFAHRQTFSYGNEDPVYQDWFRLESPGDAFAGQLWVHTFDRILPAEEFGESHPEYYSFINGERRPGKASQWCLTNPEVLEKASLRLDSIFKAHPGQQMISVSQNDGNFTYCTCPSCAAIDEREGSPSGTLIYFVNQLAERFPDKVISTLAYLYSMPPPKYARPRENVNIMLCSIDAMREVPLTESKSGQEFAEALKGWAEISDNLFVWDYGINFDNLVSPFPNFHVLQPNMALFHQHNVRMHFAQVGGKRGEDFSELRAFMLARLLWDPYQDADSLMQTFMQGYYGPAAPFLYQYQKMLEAALLSADTPLWIYDTPVTHKNGMLRPRLMARYIALFDKAEAAVAAQPELLERVRRSRLPLQYARLEIARTDSSLYAPALEQQLDTFLARCIRFEVKTLNERNNRPQDYVQLYRERYLSKPSGNLAKGAEVAWEVPPAPAYQEKGEAALTDELFGGTTFGDSWVGWEGVDGSFVIDLGKAVQVRSVEADFLHQLGAWILLPKSVTYSYSADGTDFLPFGKKALAEDRSREVKFVGVKVESARPVAARYIRVEVEGVKVCPPWHYGVGYPAWFFLDEVIVR